MVTNHSSTKRASPPHSAIAMGGITQSKPVSSINQQFNECYRVSPNEVIGVGGFAVILKGEKLSTKEPVAIKVVQRGIGRKSKRAETALAQEWRLMEKLRHPSIVTAYDLFVEEKIFCMTVEFISGGDLFDRVLAKKTYTETDARDLIKNLLKALKYLHSNSIVHRDIKPGNVLLADQNDNSTLKLCDFGVASQLAAPSAQEKSCIGYTVGYAAPELFRGERHGTAVDMFAVGCILFVLLSGTHPFADKETTSNSCGVERTVVGHKHGAATKVNDQAVNTRVLNGDWSFDDAEWSSVTAGGKDLVQKLLAIKPAERLTAEQALENDWINNEGVSSSVSVMCLERLRGLQLSSKGVKKVGSLDHSTHMKLIAAMSGSGSAEDRPSVSFGRSSFNGYGRRASGEEPESPQGIDTVPNSLKTADAGFGAGGVVPTINTNNQALLQSELMRRVTASSVDQDMNDTTANNISQRQLQSTLIRRVTNARDVDDTISSNDFESEDISVHSKGPTFVAQPFDTPDFLCLKEKALAAEGSRRGSKEDMTSNAAFISQETPSETPIATPKVSHDTGENYKLTKVDRLSVDLIGGSPDSVE